MALKNRDPFNSTIEPKLLVLLNQLSKDSRIPKTKLTDEAITDLLKKYGYEIKD